jgi:hypothetical protein
MAQSGEHTSFLWPGNTLAFQSTYKPKVVRLNPSTGIGREKMTKHASLLRAGLVESFIVLALGY